MLGKALKYLFVLTLFVALLTAASYAEEPSAGYDPSRIASNDFSAGYKAIAKVKPPAPAALKVKPYSGVTSRFDALSRYNPVNWGPDCYLPVPAKGQFVIGPRFHFASIQGDVRRGPATTGMTPSNVDFADQLGFKKSGNSLWSLDAYYQFRPRWGIKYSFSPINLTATHTPATSFNFSGQTFTGGSQIYSKWDHYEHRAGLVFNLSQTANGITNFFAEWLYIQDKLAIGGTGAGVTSVTWDTSRNLASLGLEFGKCLKNYKGNTLAINGRGGISFLDDSFGWEAELGLSYLIPIKAGRFGFIKGGYRYANLRTERNSNLFETTVDGAFLQVGFLF